MSDGTQAITDDELLYRRVPAKPNWYRPDQSPPLTPLAFKPTKDDVTGLSLVREKYVTAKDAAKGRPGKSYCVAVLRTGDLRECGIEVAPDPLLDDPGHAEIRSLTCHNHRTDRGEKMKTLLATRLCLEVLGPFTEQ